MIRTFGVLGTLVLGGLLGLWLTAPQIFRLWSEGFPSADWPAPGHFAQVAGARPATAPPPAEQGLSTEGAALFSDSGGRGFVMETGGALTREHYAPGNTRDTRLNSYSLVKSLIGILVLRAHAEGRIADLRTSLRVLIGPEAPDITVADALTMTSGLRLRGEPPKPVEQGKPLDDDSFSPFSPVARMHAFGIESILDRLRVDPQMRGVFHYQSANTALLGLAVERAYDRPLPALLSDLIWAPAGAAPAQWRRNPTTGRASAYCCLYARPIDWLLVGRYLLDNGTPEAPLLPIDLWQRWLMPALTPEARRTGTYGWHIRHDVLDRPGAAVSGPFAYMMGHRGQVVYLLPDQDSVVVRFGDQPQLLHSTLYTAFAP